MHALNDLSMVRFLIGLFALLSSAVYAQNAYVFNASNFVVGEGPDTAYLVVDFQSAGAWDPPSSFYEIGLKPVTLYLQRKLHSTIVSCILVDFQKRRISAYSCKLL